MSAATGQRGLSACRVCGKLARPTQAGLVRRHNDCAGGGSPGNFIPATGEAPAAEPETYLREYGTPWGTWVQIFHLADGQTTEHVASTSKVIAGPGIVMVITHKDGGRDQHIVTGCTITSKGAN